MKILVAVEDLDDDNLVDGDERQVGADVDYVDIDSVVVDDRETVGNVNDGGVGDDEGDGAEYVHGNDEA